MGRPRSPARGSRPTSAAVDVKASLRRKLRARKAERYVLRLYVTGMTQASRRAVERVRQLCDERLRGRYALEVIDIYQLPALAKNEQIIATPTLVRLLPVPLRRFIGNLASIEKVLFGLDLRAGTA